MDIIENKNFRKIIFDRLFEDLSDKTYYPYGSEIWIVDFINNEWYLNHNSIGTLQFNRKFFDSFFRMFSLNQTEYKKLIQFWFETNTGERINHVGRRNLDISYYIDGIRRGDGKKWSLDDRFGFSFKTVSRYLELKREFSEEKIKLSHFFNKNGLY